MNKNYTNIVFAAIVVIASITGIFLLHDYIYVVSYLEKIEFAEIPEYCFSDCKMELEKEGYTCDVRGHSGYVCVPPINQERVEQRKDYWDYLSPVNYGYLELVYDDGKNYIGFLKETEILNENQIKATFKTVEQDKYMNVKSLPEENYEDIRIMNVGDAFIPLCHDENIFVYKLHDIVIDDDVSYAIFIYRIGTSDIDTCSFPEFLEHSFNVNFDI